jgi:hypothetical protein
MLGSNQRPLPCESSIIVCWRFLEVEKYLQISILLVWHFSWIFRILAWVAARLLHTRHARQDSNLRPSLFVVILAQGQGESARDTGRQQRSYQDLALLEGQGRTGRDTQLRSDCG